MRIRPAPNTASHPRDDVVPPFGRARAAPATLSPGVPPEAVVRRPSPLPAPFGDPGLRLVHSLASAVAGGVEAVGLTPGDEVLAPAYHRGHEVDALLRSGIRCRFYDATPSLAPVPEQLEALAGPKVRALYLTHHLGFAQNAAAWRRWCDERGLILIEDAGEAWLSTHDSLSAGASGELAVFGLRHPLGLPDGAAYLAAQGGADGDETLQGGDAPSSFSRFLLPRLFDPGIPARRRANYALLLEALGDQVPEPFSSLPGGACPVGFPVETDDPAALLARLWRQGVRARARWTRPHPSLPVKRFPGAAARRARTVILPVHQELRPEDLDRSIAAIDAHRLRGRDLDLERVERFEDAPRTWPALARRAGHVFATREWAETWWRHFGRNRPLALVEGRDRGATVAILPLYVSSPRPARVLRFVGHGPADRLGPVCAPENTLVAARALRRAITSARVGGDVLIADYLPGDAGWSALLGGRTTGRLSSPVLRTAGLGWDDVLASWSSNFRQQVRSRERRLARNHVVRFRLADDPARHDADLTTLIALHRMHWGDGSTAFAGPLEAFHRDFAALALERGWLRLWFLLVDERPVAAWYGFRFEGSESFYQGGRDPAWDRASVGLILMTHTIREAVRDGVGEYRLLNGDEPYKARFASEDPGAETIAVAGSARGRAVLSARRATARAAALPAAARAGMRGRRDASEAAS